MKRILEIIIMYLAIFVGIIVGAIISVNPVLLTILFAVCLYKIVTYIDIVKKRRLMNLIKNIAVCISLSLTAIITIIILIVYGIMLIHFLDISLDLSEKLRWAFIKRETISIVLVSFIAGSFALRELLRLAYPKLLAKWYEFKKAVPILLKKLKNEVITPILIKTFPYIFAIISIWCFVHTIYTVYKVFF